MSLHTLLKALNGCQNAKVREYFKKNTKSVLSVFRSVFSPSGCTIELNDIVLLVPRGLPDWNHSLVYYVCVVLAGETIER